MPHDHHHHGHNQHSAVDLAQLGNAFLIAIIFNFLFVIIEVVVGIHINSLSLLSDAGHNLSDVASLAFSMLAFKLAGRKPSDKYTYGLSKTSILVALLNAIVLLLSIGAISYEAIQRLIKPEPLPGITISIVAGIGIFINAGTAMLFMRQKDLDLNVKSAYLHLASDAAVSLALVIGGIIIYYTHFYLIDAVLSLIVAAVIVAGTWRLLRDSLRLSLDGVPIDIDIETVKDMLRNTKGVQEVHHIHIWALSTTVNALTAHLVINKHMPPEEEWTLKKNIRHELTHLNIHHATLETEFQGQSCDKGMCEE